MDAVTVAGRVSASQKSRRRSGILLHPTSLPGPHGIGDLGPNAYRFVDFLTGCRQGAWQVLPLGPAGSGNSPYQPFSAFAGNPLLISLELLVEKKALRPGDLRTGSGLRQGSVRYDAVRKFKEPRLRLAYERFSRERSPSQARAFSRFCRRNRWWLDDYVLFAALVKRHAGAPWTDWEKPLRRRSPRALAACRRDLADDIECEKYVQFEFLDQWRRLRSRCNSKDIKLIGDLPIFVAHNSADVWANQRLFDLDPSGRSRFVAGVPPDYFSAGGQLWGNPLYRWQVMRRTGYQWWIGRLKWSLDLFDLLRLDHFRGFEKFWQVRSDARTAIKGRWLSGPGESFLARVQQRLGNLPLIAEDLGIITEEVDALRDRFELPGMRVIQFAFSSSDRATQYRPHNYVRNCVAYTATHDNNTTMGWFNDPPSAFSTLPAREVRVQRALARSYTGANGSPVNWAFIRAVLTSIANLAIIPLQDVIGLGSEARMNRPGTAFGNWEWRFRWRQITGEARTRLRALTELTNRSGGAADER